jgi:hypothetical protein
MAPDFAGFSASSLRSSLRLDFRVLASNPWHWKQCSESSGRTSRLKRISSAASVSIRDVAMQHAIQSQRKIILLKLESNNAMEADGKIMTSEPVD